MGIFTNKSRQKQFAYFNVAYQQFRLNLYNVVSDNLSLISDKFDPDDYDTFTVRSVNYLLGEEEGNPLSAQKQTVRLKRALEILELIHSEAENMFLIEDIQALLLPLLEWKTIRLARLMGDEYMNSKEGKFVLDRINKIPDAIRERKDYRKRLRDMAIKFKETSS